MGNTETKKMARTKAKKIRITESLATLVRTCVSVEKVLNDLSLLDLTYATPQGIVELIRQTGSQFYEKFDINTVHVYTRVLLLDENIPGAEEHIVFTDAEINSMNDQAYLQLLEIDFAKYQNLKNISKRSNDFKAELYSINPAYITDNKVEVRFSARMLRQISRDNKSFINQHLDNLDFTTTCAMFWEYMGISSATGPVVDKFIKYIHTLPVQDIRILIGRYPRLLNNLTIDVVDNSRLTCKQWLNLIKSVKSHSHIRKSAQQVVISTDVLEHLKFGLTTELLSGKSKLSTHVKNAIKNIEQDCNEDKIHE